MEIKNIDFSLFGKGNFVTYTGKVLNIHNPRVDLIDIEDIARQLSRIPRYNGATRSTYTAAQHSVLVATLINPPSLFLHGLLHDATEAYLGGIIKPLKEDLNDYLAIELHWQLAIEERFNLQTLDPLHTLTQIKKADIIAYLLEGRDLLKLPANMIYSEGQKEILKTFKSRHIVPQSEQQVYRTFMTMYNTHKKVS